jgi:hypothetical protein
LRDLPSAIHSAACAARLRRVSSRFASPTHSMYSRRALGEKPSKTLRAALLFFRATSSYTGIAATGFASLRAGRL